MTDSGREGSGYEMIHTSIALCLFRVSWCMLSSCHGVGRLSMERHPFSMSDRQMPTGDQSRQTDRQHEMG